MSVKFVIFLHTPCFCHLYVAKCWHWIFIERIGSARCLWGMWPREIPELT